MEVIIGFAFGYWVGTRQGREGLLKAVAAAQTITTSPEARNLLEEGITLASSFAPGAADFLGRANGDNNSVALRDAIDEFVTTRFGRRLPNAA